MKRCIRFVIATAICAVSLQLTGCAQMTMTPPKPTVENAVKLRGKAMTPAAVGKFTIDPRKPAGMDQGVSIRTNQVSSPVNGSFAQYLGETLKVELQSAGLYDPNAKTVITGTLAESDVDASIGVGKASLAARFVVARAGEVKYDREIRVNSAWDSPFVGAVAVPLAAGEYERLYRTLVGKLFDDVSFGKALAKD